MKDTPRNLHVYLPSLTPTLDNLLVITDGTIMNIMYINSNSRISSNSSLLLIHHQNSIDLEERVEAIPRMVEVKELDTTIKNTDQEFRHNIVILIIKQIEWGISRIDALIMRHRFREYPQCLPTSKIRRSEMLLKPKQPF